MKEMPTTPTPSSSFSKRNQNSRKKQKVEDEGGILNCISSCFQLIFVFFLLILGAIGIFLLWPMQIDDSIFIQDVNPSPRDNLLNSIITHSYFEINGIKLHLVEAGPKDGQLMIFLHGFPETATLTWKEQIIFFSQQGYHVIASDMRGYNTSDKPIGISSYQISILIKDILGIIDAFRKEKEKVILVGHDWGGLILWKLLEEENSSEIIEKAIVINCPYYKALERFWKQYLRSWYIYFFQLPYLPEERFKK